MQPSSLAIIDSSELPQLSRTRHTRNLFFLCADDYNFESFLQELEIPPVRMCRMRVRERADVQQLSRRRALLCYAQDLEAEWHRLEELSAETDALAE
jgi:hypothetical protein